MADLVYRPYQVSNLTELRFLHGVADRFVVNQLDTIAFENPAYFGDATLWREYRDVTRLALGVAHGVAFLSEHGRRSAAAAGLLTDHHPSAIVSCGVGDQAGVLAATPPVGLGEGDDGFLLCIGASYLHKNRRFALDLWSELRRRGWSRRIVLAGPTPPFGNSLDREAEFVLGAPQLRSEVVTLGAVSEAEKQWLYRHAALVLYPSSVEGFGLVPFEAAAHGTPTLSTRRGSLAEVLPASIPVLEDFQISTGADLAWRLLHDPEAAQDLVATVRARGACFTWDRTAGLLVELFADALHQPRGRTAAFSGEDGQVVVFAPRGARRPSEAAEALERLVHTVVSRPAWKQVLSPNGSRRQQAARTMISRARRQLG